MELNHFSLEVSLLIWKMNVVQHREKQEHFLQYIVHFVNPNMWMLTFTVVLGYQDLLLRDFLWIFFVFFQSDRPTQYQEMPLTLNGN